MVEIKTDRYEIRASTAKEAIALIEFLKGQSAEPIKMERSCKKAAKTDEEWVVFKDYAPQYGITRVSAKHPNFQFFNNRCQGVYNQIKKRCRCRTINGLFCFHKSSQPQVDQIISDELKGVLPTKLNND